jgi:hypothetical protein
MTHAGSSNTLTASAKARRFALAACALALLLAAFAASPAGAEVTLCGSTGTAAGQCSSPQGIATDFETGRTYVADRGNNRIDVFNASDGAFLFAFGWGVADGSTAAPQTCTTTCFKGIGGFGAGQFEQPTRIAVDNIAGSLTRHNVYVVSRDYRWQSFEPDGTFVRAVGWGVKTGAGALETCTTASGCQAGKPGAGQCQLDSGGSDSLPDPISVGPGGNVFLAAFSGSEPNYTVRVEKFSPAGACLGETKPEGTEGARVRSLAVDSAEHFYLVDLLVDLGGQLRKYEWGSGAQLCDPTPGVDTNALALDAADHLFASQLEFRPNGPGFRRLITEVDSACNPVRRFGYGKIKVPAALAPFSSPEGDIFVDEEGDGGGSIAYLKFPPPGPIAIPGSPEAVSIGAVKATIKAEVNPEGKATEVHTEYVTQAHFEAEGFANALKGAPVTLAAGFDAKGVSAVAGCKTIAEGSCLEPLTTYRYRVVATNPDNPTGTGEGTVEGELPFTTQPHFKAAWSSEVGTDSARLSGEADPFGIPTSGYFEYVDDATYQADKGSGDGFQHATRVPDPQPPASEAKLSFGEGEGAVVKSVTLYPLALDTTYHYRLVVEDPLQQQVSAAGAFTTFRPETPPSCPANEAFRIGPAALLPDCRAYEMVSPVDKAGGDIHTQPEFTTNLPATLNQAATSGAKIAYGSYRAFGDSASAPYTSQYIATREPGVGWSSHAISPSKGAPVKDGVVADGEFRSFSDDLCESWLTTFSDPPLAAGASAGYFNLYRRTDQLCGGAPDFETISTGAPAHQSGGLYRLEMQGRSADGSVVAYAGTDNLKGTSAPANTSSNKAQLYLKQSGGALKFACILPGGAASTNACEAGTGDVGPFGITRIGNFTNAVSVDGKRIFWTDSNAEGRIYLRENPFAKGGECATPTAPCTLDVSKATEVAAATSSSQFWTAADDGSKAIFSSGDGLYEFEVGSKTTTKIAGGFLGFMGASDDASHVYFASSQVLSGEAKNSNGDKAQPGKPNLYLYEAGSPGAPSFIGTLSTADVVPQPANRRASSATARQPRAHNGRVSADGTHAAFLSTAPLTGYDNTDALSGKADNEAFVYDASDGKLVCASCNPSGGRPEGRNAGGGGDPFWIAARLPVYASVFYTPRVLSADGARLYFEAADSLVARDTNGAIDVYEWEQLGAGGASGCKESDVTYSSAAAGCISLISSGQSAFDSEFVDASPSGDDAFFTTASSLVPQDPGQLDIYDARAGGGLPSPPSPPAACEGEACQGPYRPPEDPTPASAAFNGAGNVNETVAKKKQKRQKQKKHQKKRKAKKQHSNRKGRSAR